MLSLTDLVLPQPTPHFAFKYDITELSTAVKPFLLEHLLRSRRLDRILYLDPDILVTHPLDGLFAHLDSADFVLTPHVDQDYPEDGLAPGDGHILTSGIFNLGFFGIRASENSRSFLRWWQGKLADKCVIAHAHGYFVDQRFIDLAFTLFPGFFIEKDTGYNVAYWNLHSRRLSREETTGRWRCNAGPLYFFHFSNYKFEQPEAISGFLTRYRLNDRPDLAPLFSDYRRRLIENGYEQTRSWPYSYGSMRSGRPIPYFARSAYRYRTARRPPPADDPFCSSRLSWLALVGNLTGALRKRVARIVGPWLKARRNVLKAW